jgi:hypothetical protein
MFSSIHVPILYVVTTFWDIGDSFWNVLRLYQMKRATTGKFTTLGAANWMIQIGVMNSCF